MTKLYIAEKLSLPIEVVTQTIAILAKRRAGKSYTMRKLTEQLLEANQQIVIVDPKGDQWGIRSSADGKKPGFPIVILGGEHGDAPLEPNAGEVVAKLVVEERVSILLDLSVFRKHEVATFMAIFLENLYRLKAQEAYRTPVMLIIDEADAIAPQRPQKGEERMLGAAEDIVRRGGQRGIGCALITQRSAVLNKNVLTQAQMLIVLRTIAPQDLAAMKAWIDVHGSIEEGKQLMDSLPSLPIGDAWFWSPGWPTEEGIFSRSHVLPIETFDSGATPKPGLKPVIPKNLADVDLNALKKQMAATIEKHKNDDPKLLRKKIGELEKQLTARTAPGPVQDVKVKIIEKKVLKDSQINRLEKLINKMSKEAMKHGSMMTEYWGTMNDLATSLLGVLASISVSKNAEIVNKGKYTHVKTFTNTKGLDVMDKTIKEIRKNNTPPTHVLNSRGIEPVATFLDESIDSAQSFGKCARMIYSYLSTHCDEIKTKTQVAVATLYSQNSGGFNNAISELSAANLIKRYPSGLSIINNPSVIRKDLIEGINPSLEAWSGKLGACSRAIWKFLLESGDLELDFRKEDVAEHAGYSSSSGGFNNSVSELSALGLIERVQGGMIRINPEILNL